MSRRVTVIRQLFLRVRVCRIGRPRGSPQGSSPGSCGGGKTPSSAALPTKGGMGILCSGSDEAAGACLSDATRALRRANVGEVQPVTAAFSSSCWRLMQSA